MTNSWSKWEKSQWEQRLPWTPPCWTRKGSLGLCCSDHEMVETPRAGRGIKCELTTLKRDCTLVSSRIFLEQSHGIRLWGEDGSRKLANIQLSPPSSLSCARSEAKMRGWTRGSVDKLGAPGPQKGKLTQTWKGSRGRVEAGMCHLGEIQRHCPGTQGLC